MRPSDPVTNLFRDPAQAPEVAATVSDAPMDGWFRFGDGFLRMQCPDGGFMTRFGDLYRECAVPEPPAGAVPVVRCRVTENHAAGRVDIAFDDPEPFDQLAFTRSLFHELDCESVASPTGEGEALECGGHPGYMVFLGSTVVAQDAAPWRSLLAATSLFRVFRLQKNVLFFHAGSVAIGGRGLLIIGPSGAGKTTLSMALADRGHVLLGDEYGAVRIASRELIPFRRRLFVRPGARAPGVERALDTGQWPMHTYGDGSTRVLVHAESLFPGANAEPAPLSAVALLQPQAATVRVRPLSASARHLRYLTPHEANFWRGPPGAVAIQVIDTLSSVPWFEVQPGTVTATAQQLERLVDT